MAPSWHRSLLLAFLTPLQFCINCFDFLNTITVMCHIMQVPHIYTNLNSLLTENIRKRKTSTHIYQKLGMIKLTTLSSPLRILPQCTMPLHERKRNSARECGGHEKRRGEFPVQSPFFGKKKGSYTSYGCGSVWVCLCACVLVCVC